MIFRPLTFFSLVLIFCSCQSKPEEKIEIPLPDFVSVSAGKYSVGRKGHHINPKREVELESFEISTTEITNTQWEAFIQATNYKTDAEKFKNAQSFYPGLDEFEWVSDTTAYWRFPFGVSGGGIEDKMNHPVSCISFRDVMVYCEWAGVRLPTLDEWEVACRAGTDSHQFFGQNESDINQYGNIWQSKRHKEVTVEEDYLYTSPVASYKANPWGLYDVYGNVFEFCGDKPEKKKDKSKIAFARGGSWWCSRNSCNYFNSYDIGSVSIYASFPNQGFRVVKIN